MNIQIKKRYSDEIRFEGEYIHLKDAVVTNKANLRGADLRGTDLSGADLRSADLYGADLRGADLSGTDLRGADLRGADLSGADLRSADLYGADLRSADLRSATARFANLRGADLRFANLRGADLDGEELKITPIQMLGLRWFILITPGHMVIGCKRHTHKEWATFNRAEISSKAPYAWDWWKNHKKMLLNLCEIHRKESEK